MNKLLQDGLKINKTVHLSEEKKKDTHIISKVIQVLVLLTGTMCFTMGLKEGLNIPFDTLKIALAIILYTGIAFVLCQIPYFHVLKVYFGVFFYGLYLYSILPSIINGFYIIENLVIDCVSDYYGLNLNHFMANYSYAEKDTTLFLIIVIIPLIALISVAVVKSRLRAICSLILCIPLASIFLFGMIPSEKLLLAYIVIVLYLSRSGYSLHRVISKEQKSLIHRINSRAAVWISLFTIFMFLLLKVFINNDNYSKVETIKTAKSELQTVMNNLSYSKIMSSLEDMDFFGKTIFVGGLSGGKLGKAGEVIFTNAEQLCVTLPYDALESNNYSIYLKGYVGSVYTGNRWEQLSGADKKKYKELQVSVPKKDFQPLNQTNQLLKLIFDGYKTLQSQDDNINSNTYNIMQGVMKIEYKNANKNYIYAPYLTDFNQVNDTYEEEDLYHAPLASKKEYDFNYFFNFYMDSEGYDFFADKIGHYENYSKYEKLYRKYVHDVYTRLPANGVERLKQDFSKPELQGDKATLSTKIDYVRNFLNTSTKYTLSPGVLPKGKDYVEYFLYENKQGYCAHYASAATLMLRAMGVPARYVEGYVVRRGEEQYVQPNQTVTVYGTNYKEEWNEMSAQVKVTDKNAHAWVEVYVDGCGWFPVELTPGSNYDSDLSTLNNLTTLKPYFDEVKATPTPKPIGPTPTHAVIKPNDTKPVDPIQNQNNTTKTHTTWIKISAKTLLAIVLAILVIVSFITLLYWRIIKHKHLLGSEDRNKKALYLLVQADKMLSYHQVLPGKGMRVEDSEEYLKEQVDYLDPTSFSSCMMILRKARFAQGSISPEELQEVERFHKNLYRKIYQKLPIYKKLYWKLMLLM